MDWISQFIQQQQQQLNQQQQPSLPKDEFHLLWETELLTILRDRILVRFWTLLPLHIQRMLFDDVWVPAQHALTVTAYSASWTTVVTDYLEPLMKHPNAQQAARWVNVHLLTPNYWHTLLFLLLLLYLTSFFMAAFWSFLCSPIRTLSDLKQSLVEWLIDMAKSLPIVGHLIQREMDRRMDDVKLSLLRKEITLLASNPKITSLAALPTTRWSPDKVTEQLRLMAAAQDPQIWKSGKVSGTVYHGLDTNLTQVLNQAYELFSHTNPLHPDVFPLVRKMESEVVAMCLAMFQCPEIGGKGGCGNMTSGGTESILMACKAYREGYAHRTSQPVMIVPETVHAAFDKACGYFGIGLVKIGLNKDGRVDLKQVEKHLTSDVIMIAGSAPNYPHGVVDDIVGLGKLALKYDVGLHVDCCLGSFIMPHLAKAGFNDVEPFDFSVPGVTSISCDTHKFGFAPKGSSVILYRYAKTRHAQYFVSPDWTGGIYASPTIAGSRPGALVASCWAALVYMGEPGYVDATRAIVSTARKIRDAMRQSTGAVGRELEVCYEPLAMVVAFKARPRRHGVPALNIYSVGDAMAKMGWNLNALQSPPALHICCTMPTTKASDQFLVDLEKATHQLAQQRDEAVKSGQRVKEEGNAAIYGMAESIPDKRLIGDITKGYLDGLTAIAPKSSVLDKPGK